MNSRSTYPRLGDKFHSLTFSAGIFSYVYHCALKFKNFLNIFYREDPTPFTQHLAKPPERAGPFMWHLGSQVLGPGDGAVKNG
jgi:hypothetical protein